MCGPTTRSQVSLNGYSIRFPVKENSATIPGNGSRGSHMEGLTHGVDFHSTKSAAGSSLQPVRLQMIFMVDSGRVPISLAIALSRSTPRPVDVYGTTRLYITTSGI